MRVIPLIKQWIIFEIFQLYFKFLFVAFCFLFENDNLALQVNALLLLLCQQFTDLVFKEPTVFSVAGDDFSLFINLRPLVGSVFQDFDDFLFEDLHLGHDVFEMLGLSAYIQVVDDFLGHLNNWCVLNTFVDSILRLLALDAGLNIGFAVDNIEQVLDLTSKQLNFIIPNSSNSLHFICARFFLLN